MTATTEPLAGIDFSENSSTATFPVGTRARGEDNTEWIYIQDSGSGISQYDWVTVDENYDATTMVKAAVDDGHFIGVVQNAITADYYGWVCVQGANVSAKFLATTAADTALYTTASAGYLGTTATGQTKVDGVVAVATTASAGAWAAVETLLTHPKSGTF